MEDERNAQSVQYMYGDFHIGSWDLNYIQQEAAFNEIAKITKINSQQLNKLKMTFEELFDGQPVKKPRKETLKEKRAKLYEKRTVNSYKILTKEIREDFEWILRKFIQVHETQIDYYKRFVSPNGYFQSENSYLDVILSFPNGRNDRSENVDYHHFLIKRQSSYAMYSLDDDYYRSEWSKSHEMIKKLMVVAHKIFLEKLYTDQSVYKLKKTLSFLTRKDYYLSEKCSEEIRGVLQAVTTNNYSSLCERTAKFGYCHFIYNPDNQKICYTYRGKEVLIKVGKGIKKLLKVFNLPPINDEKIKQCNDRVMCTVTDFEMRVVDGSDIDKYYNGRKYDDSFPLGSLGSSCMRSSECIDDDYFEVYKDNAEMLILVHPVTDLIIGRAILWKDCRVIHFNDKGNDDIKIKVGSTVNIMDRIYSLSTTYPLFFNWASENGYYRKRYQSYDNEQDFVPPNMNNGDEVEIRMELDIDLTDYSNLPYMDTFPWCENGVCRNDEGWGTYEARDTCGGLIGRRDEDW